MTTILSSHGIQDPFQMRINEVQLDNMVPFVECKLTLPHGTYRPTLTNGYGLILAQLKLSHVKKKDKVKFLDVKGYIDLQQVVWHHGDTLKVISLAPILGPGLFPNNLDIPPEQYKAMGFKHELLTVEDDNVLGIFLVYDKDRNLLNQNFLPAFSTSSKQKLIQFIKNNKIDSVIIRGPQGPLNVKLMKTELGVESNQYLIDSDTKTISKCKSNEEAFNLKNFKFGVKSPGMLSNLIF